ncbi:MAG: VOC family protein [Actinobacteria bacterium]|nr:VOC family protein [Actinomycetota bacterium]MSY64131.1 VOC family protein [Actinomycetota bacterium]MSZ91049.1 VOC family protein [Actinomycetota bacterium]
MEFAMTTIVVDDYDRAIDYYTNTLGFTLTEDTVLSPEKRWVTVRPGTQGASILLARAATEAQASRIGNQTGGRVGFFLHTDTFDADYSRMKAAGVVFIDLPRTEEYGKVIVFVDLYGNKWDFIG